MSSSVQNKLKELHRKKIDKEISRLTEMMSYIESLINDLESAKECVWSIDEAEFILKKIRNEINDLLSLK